MNRNSNWIKVKFEEIVENITDRIDKPSESGLKYYIGLDQLDTDQIRIKRFASTADVNATKFLCKKGDIIFGKRNAYLRKVGISDKDAVVSAHSMVLRPIGDLIEPEFLPCLLQSSTFWKVAFSVSEGSMSPTIKWKIISQQEFMIPPKEEQRKISELLWKIEDNIDKTEKFIEIIQKSRFNFLEGFLRKQPPLRIDVLGNVCEKIADRDHTTPKYFSEGPFLISPRNFNGDYEIDFTNAKKISQKAHEKNKLKTDLKKGDTLFSRIGTIGLVRYLDGPSDYSILHSLVMLRPNLNHISSRYLYHVMNSSIIKNQTSAGVQSIGVPDLGINKIREFKIPVYDSKIDSKIVKDLDLIEQSHKDLLQYYKDIKKLKKKLTDEILKGNVKI